MCVSPIRGGCFLLLLLLLLLKEVEQKRRKNLFRNKLMLFLTT